MNKKVPKVAVIHEGELFREGLIYLLEENNAFDVVLKGDPSVLREITDFEQIDILLIDVGLFIDYQEEISYLNKAGMKRIVLSNETEEAKIVEAFLFDFDGFLTKQMAGAVFVKGVTKISQGQHYLDPTITTILVKNCRKLLQNQTKTTNEIKKHPLTQREFTVLKKVSQGEDVNTIAENLGISVNTVQIHLNKLYTKLNVNSKTQAIVEALRNRWLRV